jgi:hypothetical protein
MMQQPGNFRAKGAGTGADKGSLRDTQKPQRNYFRAWRDLSEIILNAILAAHSPTADGPIGIQPPNTATATKIKGTTIITAVAIFRCQAMA